MDDRTDFGVPAGWYPDPLGLPQLRWWDSQAWTEHTSEARAPIVIQPATRVAYAEEEELPSRREQRERERREAEQAPLVETDEQSGELSAQPLLAMTLKELEPPLEDTVEEATPGPRRASAHTNRYGVSESGLPALAEDLEQPVRERGPREGTRTYTVAVWTIALMPVLQLAVSIVLLLTGFGHNLPLMILVWIAPYAIVLGLAAYDRLELRSLGHKDPASPLWAFLTAPGYLIMRAVHTVRETGIGFAPLIVWGSLSVTLLAAIVALPGLLISVLPGVFSGEIERIVSADAAALGAQITVDCPASPPVLIGEAVTCQATKPSGESDSIVVALDRENGWITWRVLDWGVWVLTDD